MNVIKLILDCVPLFIDSFMFKTSLLEIHYLLRFFRYFQLIGIVPFSSLIDDFTKTIISD